MIITTADIQDICQEDKQIIYDALVNYFNMCGDLAKSKHFAHENFKASQHRAERMLIKIRTMWQIIH